MATGMIAKLPNWKMRFGKLSQFYPSDQKRRHESKKADHQNRLFSIYINDLQTLAERRGFEPRIGYKPIHAFQACDFNRSSISPDPAFFRLKACRWTKSRSITKFRVSMRVFAGCKACAVAGIICMVPPNCMRPLLPTTHSNRFHPFKIAAS